MSRKEGRPYMPWQTIVFQSSFYIPAEWHAPGCYAIYLDGRLSYIGQSEDVRIRLVNYRMRELQFTSVDGKDFVTPWGQVRSVTIKFKPSRRYGDWLMREARLIRRLQPCLNNRGIRKQA